MYYSIDWKRIGYTKNINEVQITFLDELGNRHVRTKYYEDWIGVCTNNIRRVVGKIKMHFPRHRVLYREIGQAKKVLPYFEERLARDKLDYRSKPFYKVYTAASIKNVGRFFNRFKIAYYDPSDWLTRIYIDLCSKYDTHAFYYAWYELDDGKKGLLDSLRMIPERTEFPDWTIAAFDIEAVPLVGNHIPMGYNPLDRIVMISLIKWNRRQGIRKRLLYLLPDGIDRPLPGYEDAFRTEKEMLVHFHGLLDDAQIITGYNINAYDFPVLFSRLLSLRLGRILRRYSSTTIGADLIVSYNNALTFDLYSYVKTFSGYNLPSFKLDDVADVKLDGVRKVPVKATGIWSWYRCGLTRELFEETDPERCFQAMRPETVSTPSAFGTFRTYLDYCLQDSELVYRLFEKEMVASFLIVRANFTALNAVEALHFGNSRYLLELFKTYGARLGYFINPKFLKVDEAKNRLLLGNERTYQGALNYCVPERVYENVSVMDFASMYPSTLLSSNLCYGTCTIMSREEWLASPAAQQLVAIPYRQHSYRDFECSVETGSRFSYPTYDPLVDEFAIVINSRAEAFLPQIVKHFIEMRKHHQSEYARTKDIYHKNVQLGIKILINSLYGVMANKDSPLTYLPIAIIIVTLSRYQLLGSYHYCKNKGFEICYADTDSLMVCGWPVKNCDEVNEFLGIPNVALKYEDCYQRLLVMSKKRYVYQIEGKDEVHTKGFQKKINKLTEYMSKKLLYHVWKAIFQYADENGMEEATPSRGWVMWVETLLEAQFLCRDPKKYSIYRKMKKLEEYVSQSCPSVKYLKKYPERMNDHVEYTYSRADVAASEASNWIMDAEECQWVNFEQLFIGQKKIFTTLLNIAYWHLASDQSTVLADAVLNAIHWKKFVHAELLHWHATGGRSIALLVEPGVKYTFSMNDHTAMKRQRGRKRKASLTLDIGPSELALVHEYFSCEEDEAEGQEEEG